MAHQVLARKWRPRDFPSLVGQDHVVRALTHALDNQRLHHAYLFTGTRGVGKTTIARILAKALNCERGVSSQPCGVCRACTEIDGGRFVDYIEMDAASNRGVDEMTQVLEQAVYAPSAARYKVYVIDEVHMLSTHAFNAMLKTLEEPPGHVVFVLATTDPQRVPMTVLSRCLQFNLKNMAPAAIAGHLARVLTAEGVAFDPEALPHLGRAAAGSMRDALSLLDQAIAFGAGRVDAQAVLDMLGVVDGRYLNRLLDALIARDPNALVALADEMRESNAPFDRTLLELSALLQRIALAQVGAFGDDGDPQRLREYASRIPAEDLQVYYQIAVYGARDLPLALDMHTGFTMTLLRLLAFTPDEGGGEADADAIRPGAGGARVAADPSGRPAGGKASTGSAAEHAVGDAPMRLAVRSEASLVAARAPAGSSATRRQASSPRSFDGDWPALAAHLGLAGFALQFMQQSELIGHDEHDFRVRVPIKPLAEPLTVNRVRDALGAWFGRPVRLSVEVGGVGEATAAAAASREQERRRGEAEASVATDPFVQSLIRDFDAHVLPESIRPTDPR